MSSSPIGDELQQKHNGRKIITPSDSWADVPRTPEDPTPAAVYDEMAPGVPYTASELAEEFGVSRHTMQNRLNALQDEEWVRTKKHGKRTRTYWVPVE